ncbi:hypothetical protein [Caballeronia sp. 15711]|uniref:hypothetical protein n=1 Tax=Caballeronia sp. 15711 TaxID=3391029 RepID=UPI0039E64FD1
MMPDGGAAHCLPPFEQCRSREFKLRTRNQFQNILKPGKTAYVRFPDTNPLEYRVGAKVEVEHGQNRTNCRQLVPRNVMENGVPNFPAIAEKFGTPCSTEPAAISGVDHSNP